MSLSSDNYIRGPNKGTKPYGIKTGFWQLFYLFSFIFWVFEQDIVTQALTASHLIIYNNNTHFNTLLCSFNLFVWHGWPPMNEFNKTQCSNLLLRIFFYIFDSTSKTTLNNNTFLKSYFCLAWIPKNPQRQKLSKDLNQINHSNLCGLWSKLHSIRGFGLKPAQQIKCIDFHTDTNV